MSKLTVQCREYKYEVQELGGTVFVHKTFTPPVGARGVQSFQPAELIFEGSPEEANNIAQAILVMSNFSNVAESTEKAQPASESKSDTN